MITIHKQSNGINRFSIHSRHEFFNCDELTVSIKKDVIIIRKPILSDVKRCKVTHYNNGSRCITVNSDKLNIGSYEIDKEDSTEDELVIYLEL